jgi:hypothetical protein
MGKVRLRILNWEKFNEKRKDVKEPGWLRLEKRFPMSKSLWGVGPADRYVFVTLMCFACDEQSADLDFESSWFAHYYGGDAFGESELLSALRALDGKVIKIQECPAEPPPPPPPTTKIARFPLCPATPAPSSLRPRYVPETDTVRYETDGRNETDEEEEPPPPPPPKDPLERFLQGCSTQGIAKLREAYPADLITDELPKCEAQWLLDDERNRRGGKGLYLRRWLDNAKKDRDRAARESSGPTTAQEKPCVEDGSEENGRPVCAVHGRGFARACPMRNAWDAKHLRPEEPRAAPETRGSLQKQRALVLASLQMVKNPARLERLRGELSALDAKLAAFPPEPQGGSP